MQLVVCEPPDLVERVITSNPDGATVDATIKGLEWADLTFVMVKLDDDNWIEGSGSLKPEDGLSARYMIRGVEHVAAEAPRSLDEISLLLQSYAAADGRWRQLIEWD